MGIVLIAARALSIRICRLTISSRRIEGVTRVGATRMASLLFPMAMTVWRTICHPAGLAIFVSVI